MSPQLSVNDPLSAATNRETAEGPLLTPDDLVWQLKVSVANVRSLTCRHAVLLIDLLNHNFSFVNLWK